MNDDLMDPGRARPGPSRNDPPPGDEPVPAPEPNTISPLAQDGPDAPDALAGEPGIPSVTRRPTTRLSRKALFALALLGVALAVALALTLQRVIGSRHPPGNPDAGTRPAAATAPVRSLDLSLPPRTAAARPATVPAAPTPVVPAIVPTAAERTEPIGVRRTGADSPGPTRPSPEDAPVLLVTSRPGSNPSAHASADPPDPLEGTKRNLEGYQRQLQLLMDSLSKGSGELNGNSLGGDVPGHALTGVVGPGGTPIAAAVPPYSPGAFGRPAAGLFGGQLQGSATPRVAAGMLGDRSLTLPKGTAFTCALKTRVVSAASGLVGCQVQRNVFSDDGRVLLVERGSHLDGEYRILSVRPGTVRIPVLWTRLRTPLGVTVDIESPATGRLGESGLEGHVDNRWVERIGAAMLLSIIDDAVKLVIQNQSSERSGDTFVLPSTAGSSSKLAEKVLDSTINIPPLIYQNQGGIVGIYVARDVDFSAVYGLAPAPMAARASPSVGVDPSTVGDLSAAGDLSADAAAGASR